MPGAKPPALNLVSTLQKILEQIARCYTKPYYLVLRAKIILIAAAGANTEVARRLDTNRNTAATWRARWLATEPSLLAAEAEGLNEKELTALVEATLVDVPCSGAPDAFSPEQLVQIIALALKAWEAAKATFQQLAIPHAGMIVHHDQDSVYTGYRWTDQLLLQDRAHLSYALNGAKDNPEMESFNGRFKTEGRSLFLDAQTLSELRAVVREQMRYYNTERRHSSLGYLPPLTYIERARSVSAGQVLERHFV